MDAKEYLESKNIEYPLSSMDVLGCLNSIGVIELMESYHQAKSKEEAEERYEKAKKCFDMIFDGRRLSGYDNRNHWVRQADKALRIASGKEEEE